MLDEEYVCTSTTRLRPDRPNPVVVVRLGSLPFPLWLELVPGGMNLSKLCKSQISSPPGVWWLLRLLRCKKPILLPHGGNYVPHTPVYSGPALRGPGVVSERIVSVLVEPAHFLFCMRMLPLIGLPLETMLCSVHMLVSGTGGSLESLVRAALGPLYQTDSFCSTVVLASPLLAPSWCLVVSRTSLFGLGLGLPVHWPSSAARKTYRGRLPRMQRELVLIDLAVSGLFKVVLGWLGASCWPDPPVVDVYHGASILGDNSTRVYI